MKRLAALLFGFVAACNYDTGECYLRDDGEAGVGGVITPTGAGGFGEVPPEPQDGTDPPPPECNVVKDTACNEKCLTDYDEAAAKCGKIENETQRKTCQDGAHAVYKSCRDNCTQTENDCKKCKLSCDAEHDKCHAKCSDAMCHAKCNDAYGQCLKECGDCPH